MRSSLSLSSSNMRDTGMPVHVATISAMSSALTRESSSSVSDSHSFCFSSSCPRSTSISCFIFAAVS